MEGPYQLDNDVIDVVAPDHSPGVYLVRRIAQTPEYAYYAGRVGRADDDLNAALKQWLNTDYRVFWFQYVASAQDATDLQRALQRDIERPDDGHDDAQPP